MCIRDRAATAEEIAAIDGIGGIMAESLRDSLKQEDVYKRQGFALIAARTKDSVLPVSIYCDGKLTRDVYKRQAADSHKNGN